MFFEEGKKKIQQIIVEQLMKHHAVSCPSSVFCSFFLTELFVGLNEDNTD